MHAAKNGEFLVLSEWDITADVVNRVSSYFVVHSKLMGKKNIFNSKLKNQICFVPFFNFI